MSTDLVMDRLAAADPARGVEPDRGEADRLLERVVSSEPGMGRRGRPTRRRAIVVALACGLVLVLAAAALAAVGVIRFGAPARPSGLLANPRYGLGSLTPGTSRLLAVRAADPAGGPPWGLRVLSTTRGVGCLEVGRILDRQLGVLGRDGAFGDDGRFHPLPPRGLANGGQCAGLDANGRLFETVSAVAVPASGWQGTGSCIAAAPTRHSAPPGLGSCRRSELRALYYGVLGPDAVSLTYRLSGRRHTIKPVGPEGAYLILAPYSSRSQRGVLAGAGSSIMPRPWSSPIDTITYRDGIVCRIAATQPGTLKGSCTPPGYVPARLPAITQAQVAAPLRARLVRAGSGGYAIRVSFVARVTITSASSSYELVEDTSSPEAVFVATQGDVDAGHTVTWLLPAPKPGVYSGRVVFGLGGAPPYPIYTYSPGPLVGRFRIRVP